MKITRLILPPDFIPDGRMTAERAGMRVADLIIKHLRKKNDRTTPNKFGMPKRNYYADAAETVLYATSGNKFEVSVGTDSSDPKTPSQGIALHYYGGTVYPTNGKKNIALPIDPAVAGVWPSEYDPTPKHEKTFITPAGAIGDKETGNILYILLPHATIPADQTVLPTDDAICNAATLGLGQVMGVSE